MKKLILSFVLLSGISSISQATFSGYTYQSVMTIDHTKVPNTDQTNFPVWVSTISVPLKTVANGGHVDNGYDIIFSTNSDCSFKLNWDTETYRATDGAMLAWVKVPSVKTASDTTLYMCYGSSSITTYQGYSTATWDNNFIAVWHMGGSSISTADSTKNAHSLTNHGATLTVGVSSGAALFNAFESDWMDTGIKIGTGAGGIGSTATISCFFYNTSASIPNLSITFLQMDNSGSSSAGFYSGSQIYTSKALTGNNGTIAGFAQAWQQIAQSFTHTTEVGVSSGTTYTNAASNVHTNSDNSMSLAAYNFSGSQGFYTDEYIDECRISDTNRSADWLVTQFNTQFSPSTFITYAAESSTGGGTTPGVGRVSFR